MNQTQLLVVIVVFAVIAWLESCFSPCASAAAKNCGSILGPNTIGLSSRKEILARREKFKIRPLPAADRSGFAVRWNEVQSRSRRSPSSGDGCESLVSEVMQARGYPIGEFEQRAADISVDYPIVVENYRAAHAIALRHGAGQASTEDLRQAMVHYRKLFQELSMSVKRKEREHNHGHSVEKRRAPRNRQPKNSQLPISPKASVPLQNRRVRDLLWVNGCRLNKILSRLPESQSRVQAEMPQRHCPQAMRWKLCAVAGKKFKLHSWTSHARPSKKPMAWWLLR